MGTITTLCRPGQNGADNPKQVRRELSAFAERHPELAPRCRIIQHNLVLLERDPNDRRLLRQTAENVAGLEAALTTRESR